MIRRPPRSTLFPYNDALPICDALRCEAPQRDAGPRPQGAFQARSEEHASELQSQSNLVCRLLLEKKIMATILRITIIGSPEGSRNWRRLTAEQSGKAFMARIT